MGIIETVRWQLRDHWDARREARLKSAGVHRVSELVDFFLVLKIFLVFFSYV